VSAAGAAALLESLLAVLVVDGALLLVGEHLVRGTDLLELLLGLGAVVRVLVCEREQTSQTEEHARRIGVRSAHASAHAAGVSDAAAGHAAPATSRANASAHGGADIYDTAVHAFVVECVFSATRGGVRSSSRVVPGCHRMASFLYAFLISAFVTLVSISRSL
jgi:hypothetical protein